MVSLSEYTTLTVCLTSGVQSSTPPPNGLTITSATISVAKNTAVGSYPVTIRGTANVAKPPISHDVSVTVNVAQAFITGPYDASNYSLNGAVTPNPKNADLSVVSDAALEYNASQVGNDPWRKTSALNANPSGLGAGPFAYSWAAGYGTFDNAGPSSSSQTNYSVNMSDDASVSNQPFPSSTATLNIVSSIGGAVGNTLSSNTYTVRWHHTSENWKKDATKPSQLSYQFLKPDPSTLAGFPASMDFSPTARWNKIDFDYDLLIQAGEITSIAGAVYAKNPIKEGLYNYIGLQFAKLGDEIKDYSTFGGPINLRTVFEGGATNLLYLDVFGSKDSQGNLTSQSPVTLYGYKDSLSDAAKIAIESHYQAVDPLYCVPFDDTPFVGDKYDSTGYAGHITDSIYIYNPGIHSPDSHVVCRFQLKTNP